MAGFCIHVVPPSPSMRQQKETKQWKRSWLKLKRRTCYSHMWELKDFGTFLGLFSLMEHAPRHVTVRCLGLTNSGCWFTLPVWRQTCLSVRARCSGVTKLTKAGSSRERKQADSWMFVRHTDFMDGLKHSPMFVL